LAIILWQGEFLGVNVACPIVTNGEFVPYLWESVWTNRAAIWGDKWGQLWHWCIRWGPHPL